MVDSRAKGARGEYLVRDMLRAATDLQFERVPNSGALEYLKGDLYVPNEKNRFCIEVKNYSESPLTDKIFTAKKTNNLIRWWKKVVQQAEGGAGRQVYKGGGCADRSDQAEGWRRATAVEYVGSHIQNVKSIILPKSTQGIIFNF